MRTSEDAYMKRKAELLRTDLLKGSPATTLHRDFRCDDPYFVPRSLSGRHLPLSLCAGSMGRSDCMIAFDCLQLNKSAHCQALLVALAFINHAVDMLGKIFRACAMTD